MAFVRLVMILLMVAPVALGAPSQGATGERSHVPAAPQSVAVTQLENFLKAVATGDDDTSFNAVREIYSSAALNRSTWPAQRVFLQRLQFHGVERATATEAEITAYDPVVDGWAHLVASVDPRPPHQIIRMVVVLGARPKDVPAPAKLQPAALTAATRAQLTTLTQQDRFAGAVLIARRGRPILTAAYGLADREAHIPNRIDTEFRFGSLGKMFTAVAIMQLAQAGTLDLDAPVGQYLKDYPNREIATRVTINQLLTHTGGTGDIFGPEFFAHRESLRDLKDYIELYGTRAPLFEPGTRRDYSNYGFILLGRIIEVTSGLSYDEYLKRNVFTPAGMSSTGMLPESVQLPRRAVGYTASGQGELQSAADTLPYRGTSAGGGYSTVDDLLRFANALFSQRLLDAAHTYLLTAGGMSGPGGTFIPYDFAGKTLEGRRFFGHSGAAPGMNGELRIFPDDGYVVIVLANLDPPAATRVANFISDRLP
ncbi:MAG TPA: serine hydrolase domain-containing protein [Steroidobacteraceae bacterium]|nr:serine hydrolase domain-containing protein [Steroidobacteraceae bacterium]